MSSLARLLIVTLRFLVIYDIPMVSSSVSFPKLKPLPMLFTHVRYQEYKYWTF